MTPAELRAQVTRLTGMQELPHCPTCNCANSPAAA